MPLRSRKCGNTEVTSWRLRAHQQSEATVQERLHGKLERRVVYDRRRAPFGATGLPPGGLARLAGTFYEPELQKVVVSKDKTYRIEEILRWRNKRREAFVKWFGWPAAFNSWIDANTLVNYSI